MTDPRDTGRAILIEEMKRWWSSAVKAFKICCWTASEFGISLGSNVDTGGVITKMCSDIVARYVSRPSQ